MSMCQHTNLEKTNEEQKDDLVFTTFVCKDCGDDFEIEHSIAER